MAVLMPDGGAPLFISYARADGSDFARQIWTRLKEAGVPVWLDVEDIEPGKDWDEQIDLALAQARAVLLVVTTASNLSEEVKSEWRAAQGRRVPVLPLIAGDVQLPRRLTLVEAIDFNKSFEDGWGRLVPRLASLDHDPVPHLKKLLGETRQLQQGSNTPHQYQSRIDALEAAIVRLDRSAASAGAPAQPSTPIAPAAPMATAQAAAAATPAPAPTVPPGAPQPSGLPKPAILAIAGVGALVLLIVLGLFVSSLLRPKDEAASGEAAGQSSAEPGNKESSSTEEATDAPTGAVAQAKPILLSSGGNRTCVVDRSGGITCWGEKALGKGLLPGAASVAVGEEHACAITTSGGVKCWGENLHGELGDGTLNRSDTPVEVKGLSGVMSLAVGSGFTCAVTTDGEAKCWGRNDKGQLGTGDDKPRSEPTTVAGLRGKAIVIAAGFDHVCVVHDKDGVDCWGWGQVGQLGNGENRPSNKPVAVTDLKGGILAITAAGSHTCTLHDDGWVRCWGGNRYGQLGSENTQDANTPAEAGSMGAGAIAVSAGPRHSCVIFDGGEVRCWGSNASGELGDGTKQDSLVPVIAQGAEGSIQAVAVAPGGSGEAGGPTVGHTCALLTDGGMVCWGDNSAGQLGDGTTTSSSVPVKVTVG